MRDRDSNIEEPVANRSVGPLLNQPSQALANIREALKPDGIFVMNRLAPTEWSRWNVSLRLVAALAWPAEPVGVAQPATRRRQGRIPPVLAACIRAMRAA